MSSPGQIVETIGRVLDEPQDYQKDQEHCQYGIFTVFLKTLSEIMVPSQSTVVIKTLMSFLDSLAFQKCVALIAIFFGDNAK